jgi:hypothetical protein
MEVQLMARVRQILQAIDQRSPGDEEKVSLSEQGALYVAQDSSFYEEMIRVGRSFEVHTTAAVAGIVAIPTTAVLAQIWNGEPDDGRCLIIDRCWALGIAGPATAGQNALIGALGQTRVAAPAAALAKTNLNGLGGGDTRVVTATAVLDAVTGVAAAWRVLPGQTGGQKIGAAATPGVFINAEVNGRIIVPPGRAFGIHVFSDAVGNTFVAGIEWHEKNVKVA